MKPFSPRGLPLSRAQARNAILLNLLATPGLGSLLGRRWIAGGGQLLLAIAGFALFLIGFTKEMAQFYGQISGNVPVQPVGKFLAAGLILFGLAWAWSAVTSLSLLRTAASGKEQALKNSGAPPVQKMDPTSLGAALKTVPDWTSPSGTAIVRVFQFKTFSAAIQFVSTAAALAEAAWHHPDIEIRGSQVTLTLTTHDTGGLTARDFALARQFDAL